MTLLVYSTHLVPSVQGDKGRAGVACWTGTLSLSASLAQEEAFRGVKALASNDNRREFIGIDAIGGWVAKEVVSEKVTIEVREVLDQYGDTVVRVAYDGAFDRTNLPDEIAMTNYFSVRDGKIVSLMIMFN
jgi:hypothetical protein